MDDKRARFEAQVLPHLDAALRFARWLGGPGRDADDTAQEAILRAFRSFHTFRGSDSKAWLLAIVRNCHLSAVRQARRQVLVGFPDDDAGRPGPEWVDSSPGPEAVSIRRDDARALSEALAGLPEEQREILVLREIEEMDYRQIADIIDVPMGTVMSRLARARAALRARWIEEFGEVRHGVR